MTGSSYLADGFSYHAFLYDGSSMQDLGTLGGNFSAGVAISSLAQVVGDSYTSSGALHAFLFDGSSIIDLNDLIPADSGWVLMYASGINDSGQIIGIGTFFGEDRGFLLTPQ